MGLLSNSSGGRLFTRRGTVFVGVAVLHVIALLLVVHARRQVQVEPQVALMHMDLLQPDTPPIAPPKLPPPSVVQIAVPRIDIPVVDIQLPQVITPPRVVAAVAAPPVMAPAAVPNTAPVTLGVDQVEYVRRPEPRYPRAARQARLQGTVLLRVLIDTEGHPQDVRIYKSSGYEQLDREGCDAVSRALFKPYREHGVARSAQVIVPIEFSLAIRTASRN